jgi:hypothetical protein
MDIGTIWALIWVVSLVVIFILAFFGEADINSSPPGVMFGVGLLCFAVATVGCVWVASGLVLSVTT